MTKYEELCQEYIENGKVQQEYKDTVGKFGGQFFDGFNKYLSAPDWTLTAYPVAEGHPEEGTVIHPLSAMAFDEQGFFQYGTALNVTGRHRTHKICWNVRFKRIGKQFLLRLQLQPDKELEFTYPVATSPDFTSAYDKIFERIKDLLGKSFGRFIEQKQDEEPEFGFHTLIGHADIQARTSEQ